MRHYINVRYHKLLQNTKLQRFRCLVYMVPAIILLFSLILFCLWIDRVHYIKTPRPLQPKCAKNQVPQEEKIPLLTVNGTKTLLLSAYMEHRRGIKVRVIAVALRSEKPAYRCLFCCNEKLHISEGVSDFYDDNFYFNYGTVHILCTLPPECETPSHVAVTTAENISNDSRDAVFLEVKNQRVENVSLRYNFTICISTMFDYNNVLQLVQSLEMFKLLDVDKVVIYKTSCSPEIQRVLNYYINEGLVEVIPWMLSRYVTPSQGWLPEHGPGDIHYYGQIPALNDCVYRYMYQTRYVSLQDIDELILPQSVDSWVDLLQVLEKGYGVNMCYNFENNVFPNSVTLPLPNSMTLPPESANWQGVPGVNILKHLHKEPILEATHYTNFKIIVNPRAVYRPTVHGLLDSEKYCCWIDSTIARMYHIRPAKQPDLNPDQLIYDGRLLGYSSRLTKAVNKVLQETRFLCPNNSI